MKRKVNLPLGIGATCTSQHVVEVPLRASQLLDRPGRLRAASGAGFGGESSPSPHLGGCSLLGPTFHLAGNTHWAQRELLLMFALTLF